MQFSLNNKTCNFSIMFFMTHLIIFFVFLSIPFAASITFNLTNIGPHNQNREILTEGNGTYISDDGIQLTQDGNVADQTQKAGRAIYVNPLHLWDSRSGEIASFTTNFTFIIDSNGAANYSYGLTFFLSQNSADIYTGGSMGLPVNSTNINTTTQFVAVEFDTFWDRLWDPLDSSNNPIWDHVAININSVSSIRSQKWFSNVAGGGVCQAWIKFDSGSRNLSVSFTGFRNNTAFRQDGLVYTIDLRHFLPEWVFFGFSAATGGMFQKNNVRSWSFESSELEVDRNNDPLSIPSNPTLDPSKGDTRKLGLLVGLPVAITFLLILAFVLWIRKKMKQKEEEKEEIGFDIDMNNEFEMGTGPKRFSYHELARSTNDFSENEKLGEGGFGGVYRGFLKDSSTFVAVKRVSKTSKQGIKEYASEVRIISRLRHRNLVQLTGWCHQKGELLLVYEYMENGSLDSHLFKSKSLLKWTTRYKIANGLASALLYLHEEWEQCVLHRDIKSSNIMLDSNFNAKLGDFGLAKLVDHEKGSQTTILAGTLGYMAPECIVTGKATRESDVFSFGVVALEIACGRKTIDHKARGKEPRLLEWVWEKYGSGSVLEAVDPRLGSDFDEQELTRLVTVGLWCVHPDSEVRPSMRQVIQVLNAEAFLPTLPLKMPVASYLTPSESSVSGGTSLITSRESNGNDSSIKTASSTDSSYLNGR